jgi:hypothetical protein
MEVLLAHLYLGQPYTLSGRLLGGLGVAGFVEQITHQPQTIGSTLEMLPMFLLGTESVLIDTGQLRHIRHSNNLFLCVYCLLEEAVRRAPGVERQVRKGGAMDQVETSERFFLRSRSAPHAYFSSYLTNSDS